MLRFFHRSEPPEPREETRPATVDHAIANTKNPAKITTLLRKRMVCVMVTLFQMISRGSGAGIIWATGDERNQNESSSNSAKMDTKIPHTLSVNGRCVKCTIDSVAAATWPFMVTNATLVVRTSLPSNVCWIEL